MTSDYRHFTDTTDGVCGVDRVQRVVLWNRAAEHMLGFTSREAQGRYCFEMLLGSDETGCRICRHGCTIHTQALDRTVIPTRDLRVRSKSGRKLWVNLTTLHAPADASNRLTLVHLFRDVSKHKVLQEGIRRLPDGGPDGRPHSGVDDETRTSEPPKALTSREHEVLQLLAAGASTDAIADTLVVSRATARNHIHNMLNKLDAHTRIEAVALAWRNGLL